MNHHFRTGFLALIIAGFTALTVTPAWACQTGYYRFGDTTTANFWTARTTDYNAGVGGLSVFEDLTMTEYTTMANARKPKTRVYMLPCNSLINPLNATANPIQANGTWTDSGAAKHTLISGTNVTDDGQFNTLQVSGANAPNYLIGNSAQVYRAP